MSGNSQTQTAQTGANGGSIADEVNVMVKDFVDFALVVGRAAGKAAEDLSGLMVVRVGAGDRAGLDVMVNAGLAKTRAEAALRLMADGVKANAPIYQRAERARAQIEALKGELKGMLGAG